MRLRDAKSKKPGLCASAWCANKPAPSVRYCHKCRMRKYKVRNPMKYSYKMLKDGARKRGIAFELSYQEWEAFWLANPAQWEEKRRSLTESHSTHGRTHRDTWTIDRCNSDGPYAVWNIRLVSMSVNAAKDNNKTKKWNLHIKINAGSNNRLEQPTDAF